MVKTIHEQFQKDLYSVMKSLEKFLIDKNLKYGDSALTPINCFSKLSPLEGINIRLDDKIKRLITGDSKDTEDTELDLLGYLILKRVYLLRKEKENGKEII